MSDRGEVYKVAPIRKTERSVTMGSPGPIVDWGIHCAVEDLSPGIGIVRTSCYPEI